MSHLDRDGKVYFIKHIAPALSTRNYDTLSDEDVGKLYLTYLHTWWDADRWNEQCKRTAAK